MTTTTLTTSTLTTTSVTTTITSPPFYEHPKQKIVINDVEVTPDIISTAVTRRENGIDNVSLTTDDQAGKVYLSTLNLGDKIEVWYKWEDADDEWVIVFGGTIVDLNPNMSKAGEICSVSAYGFGAPLKNMRVAAEYGSQSNNPTVDTIQKAYNQVIANYVNKLMADGIGSPPVESGYYIRLSYLDVAPDELPYINFKWQDCFSALNDLLKLAGSSRYVDNPLDWAGLHWCVLPYIIGEEEGPRLLVAPIGNHESITGMGTLWSTHPLLTPIVVKEDMISHSFQHQIFEANFIAVSGRFVYPKNEFWTEGNADEWHFEWEDEDGNVTDEETIVRKGDYSVNLRSFKDANFWFDIPHMNIYALGTENDIPKLDFWVFRNGTNISVKLFTTWDRYFEADIKDLTEQGDPSSYDEKLWTNVSLEIGPYLKENNNIWTMHGTPDPDWHEICNIGFYLSGVQPMDAYIDGLQLIGSVVCCAYDSTHVRENGVRILTIKDSLASLNTLDNTDPNYDSCSLAQTALGELLRNKNDIMSGRIAIPLNYHLQGGQIVHIHASQKPDKSFQIDKDFRITQVQHNFTTDGAISILTLIDDLKNSVPRTNSSSSSYNMIIQAVNPDHQTKTLSSLKTGGDFDPKLTRVCKDYPS